MVPMMRRMSMIQHMFCVKAEKESCQRPELSKFSTHVDRGGCLAAGERGAPEDLLVGLLAWSGHQGHDDGGQEGREHQGDDDAAAHFLRAVDGEGEARGVSANQQAHVRFHGASRHAQPNIVALCSKIYFSS